MEEHITEISTQIKKLVAEKNGLKMRHHLASTRAEKLQYTKRIKAIEVELEALREEQKNLRNRLIKRPYSLGRSRQQRDSAGRSPNAEEENARNGNQELTGGGI